LHCSSFRASLLQTGDQTLLILCSQPAGNGDGSGRVARYTARSKGKHAQRRVFRQRRSIPEA
jgi:hypothetical protein